MNNKSIFKILWEDNNVNLYTKFYLVLYTIKKYGKDNYIPNQLFMNKFGISKKNVSRLINKMRKDKVIRVYYINNKRYFDFIDKEWEEIIRSKDKFKGDYNNSDILNYDWLNDKEDL